MSNESLPDYYEVLQLSPHADRDTIDRVFRHLAKRLHPDNRETGDTERFTELLEAYRVLSDPERRAKYDANYQVVRESRWRIFGEDAVTSEIAVDSRIRLAILSMLYAARRNDPDNPGLGNVEIERLLDLPQPVVAFHVWYLRENGWIKRIETGELAITAAGVDRVIELGGPAKVGTPLLMRGDLVLPSATEGVKAG